MVASFVSYPLTRLNLLSASICSQQLLVPCAVSNFFFTGFKIYYHHLCRCKEFQSGNQLVILLTIQSIQTIA
jgi:hypothetical protein